MPLNMNGTVNYDIATEMINYAIENGVNYFDTSCVYHNGHSEAFLGDVLSEYPRDSFYLTTKLPSWEIHSLAEAKSIFDEQMQRLKTEYLDFYLLQALNRHDWAKMKELGILEWCDELKKSGIIRNFGFSFHDNYEVFEQILTYREWDCCMIQFNYMDADDEHGGIKAHDLCEKLGVPLFVMEPVKGGSLSNLPADLNQMLVDINPIATASSWALRWVAGFPQVKIILSGMNNMDQLRDNIETLSSYTPLNEDEKSIIEIIKVERNKLVNNQCTYCNYCQPCPNGVSISRVFKIWNDYSVYNNREAVKWEWFTFPKEKKPVSCTYCGVCEKRCSQKISIREDLIDAQNILNPIIKDWE